MFGSFIFHGQLKWQSAPFLIKKWTYYSSAQHLPLAQSVLVFELLESGNAGGRRID